MSLSAKFALLSEQRKLKAKGTDHSDHKASGRPQQTQKQQDRQPVIRSSPRLGRIGSASSGLPGGKGRPGNPSTTNTTTTTTSRGFVLKKKFSKQSTSAGSSSITERLGKTVHERLGKTVHERLGNPLPKGSLVLGSGITLGPKTKGKAGDAEKVGKKKGGFRK